MEDVYLKWHPPNGWVKLNVNGSVCAEGTLAGCGGVLRDDSSACVSGFSQKLGRCTKGVD